MIWHSVRFEAIAFLLAASVVGSVVLGQQGRNSGLAQRNPAASRFQPPKVKASTDAQLREKTEYIRDLLSHNLRFRSSERSLLEVFLKTVRQATSSKDDPGIAIYVNPEGLEYVGMTLSSSVPVKPGAWTPASHLKYALKGAKLGYEVDHGFLKVDSRLGLVETRLGRVEETLDRILKHSQEKERLK
jgi:hypothetical protein